MTANSEAYWDATEIDFRPRNKVEMMIVVINRSSKVLPATLSQIIVQVGSEQVVYLKDCILLLEIIIIHRLHMYILNSQKYKYNKAADL